MESFLTECVVEDSMSINNSIPIVFGDDHNHYEKEDYSMWFQEGTEFIPSVNLKTIEKIPSGAYKIIWKRDDWHVIPVPINTDELYSFPNDVTSKMLEETQLFWNKSELYKQNKLAHKRGVLLCGAPGNGKTGIITMLTSQIIKEDGIVFIANNSQEFINLTETLGPVIRKIEPDRPIITVIEDVDQMVKNMNGDWQLLDFLDGKTSIDHHLVILTSNDTTDLSSALLRPSRIDMSIEIPTPNSEVRFEYFKKKGIESIEILDEYVEKTDGFSFAELKEVFIGTQILGKNIDKVISQIVEPFECKDYLTKTSEMKGID